jgi:hypothetical protein
MLKYTQIFPYRAGMKGLGHNGWAGRWSGQVDGRLNNPAFGLSIDMS